MIDSVLFLISEYLAFEELLRARAVNRGTLLEIRESTNLAWCHKVNVPSILKIFPKLKNIVLKSSSGEEADYTVNITLQNFIDWFLTSGQVVRLTISKVNFTECSQVNVQGVKQLRPPIVSLRLIDISIPNQYLCGVLLLMRNLKIIHIGKCPSMGDRASNLLLSHLPCLKQVSFEELFELQELCYSQAPVKIHELSVIKCPRLLRISPNHYLVKCNVSQTAITGKNIGDIVRTSYCLQDMIANECRNVQTVSFQSSSLMRLSLARCMLLECTRGALSVLQEISFAHCHRLRHIDIDAPELKSLALPHLPSLSQLFLTSAGLARLDLTGCLHLSQSIADLKRAAKSSPHSFAVSRTCMLSGRCCCRPLSCLRQLHYTSSKIPPSYRRCFHHNQISLCCPKLKIKDPYFLFPMSSLEPV